MRQIKSPALAAVFAIALAACGAPTAPEAASAPDTAPQSTVTPADLAAVNTGAPTRDDLITVCMFDQYTYTEADCACAADVALAEYTPKVRRLLVLDGGGALEASQETLDLIATLTDEERDQYAGHGLWTMRRCAGLTVPD